MFPTPIGANNGQVLSGTLHMTANLHRSYNIELNCILINNLFRPIRRN